jgi:hypothetical protein
MHVTLGFSVLDQGNNPVVLLRMRSLEDQSLFGISLGVNRTLNLYNDVIKAGTESSLKVDLRAWHTLTLRMSGPADARTMTVLLDGAEVPELTGAIDLQNAGIGGLQLGDSAGNRVYDVQYRDVRIASSATGAAGVQGIDAVTSAPATTPAATLSVDAGTTLAWTTASVGRVVTVHRARRRVRNPRRASHGGHGGEQRLLREAPRPP